MLAVSRLWLASRMGRSTGLPSLRRRLQHLQRTNHRAEGHLRERRRLLHLLREEKQSRFTRGAPEAASASAEAIRLLPRNDALEAAMALSISENRDARTELELMRRLLNSTLLSLASPVDLQWDPYDVKPQVFALDTYLALPVFTSIHYLRLFCHRFGFPVRDPSGVLWVAGDAANSAEVPIAGLLPDAVLESAWWQKRQHTQTNAAQSSPGTTATAPVQHTQKEGEVESEKPTTFEASTSPSEGAAFLGNAREGNTNSDSNSNSALAAAPTPPSADASAIDADALFDAMLMDSVALEDASPAAPPAAATRTNPQTEGTRLRNWQLKRKRGKHNSNLKGKRMDGLAKSGSAPVRSASRAIRRSHRRRAAHTDTASKDKESGSNGESEDVESADATASAATAAAKAAYWQALAATSPFDVKQATPLPTFGPFRHPFLLGYFADISTLLHNASIVPEKVDIVVNPGSPIEFVLARSATDRVLRKEQLLHLAYLKVEKELQREFSQFFSVCCPEVSAASSACVPLPLDIEDVMEGRKAARSARSHSDGRRRHSSRNSNGEGDDGTNALQDYRERTRLLREAEYRNGVRYELTILIQSSALEETFYKIQQAKQQSMLMGHVDLDVLPEVAAAPYVREMAQQFYAGSSGEVGHHAQQSLTSHTNPREEKWATAMGGTTSKQTDDKTATAAASSRKEFGVFVRRGVTQTINVAQSADSYFHDPTNTYTEAHSIFTEELKVKRLQP